MFNVGRSMFDVQSVQRSSFKTILYGTNVAGECLKNNLALMGQADIHRVFQGLKFDPDPREIGYAFRRAGAEIGQKRAFFKGLIL